MTLPQKLKRLLESSPATATLAKYLEKLHEDIYDNTVSDAALAVRVKAAEDKLAIDEPLLSKLAALHTHDIEFTITDGTDPVEGATITIDGKTGTSAASTGKTTINGILEGTYTVTVTCEGYEDESASKTVASDTTSFTIALTAVTPAET